MCGRYANHVGAMHGWSDILADWPGQQELGFNIAPTQLAPIVTKDGVQVYQWGLLPSWVKSSKTSFSTFNARLGTIADKPSFSHAWHNQQRCLIPALGYYEWRLEQGQKQAYFVCRKDGAPIVFGGLFEQPRQGIAGSFTIITRPAEDQLAELHHAMPLMFEEHHGESWLNSTVQQAETLAWYAYPDIYHYYPVSNQVNRVANQGPQLIEPMVVPQIKQQGFDF